MYKVLMPQNAVEAVAVLHPIATRRYVSLLKIAHWCYLPVQGDYSPDNVKFPNSSLTVRGTRRVKCYSHHDRTGTKYLYGCKYAVYDK